MEADRGGQKANCDSSSFSFLYTFSYSLTYFTFIFTMQILSNPSLLAFLLFYQLRVRSYTHSACLLTICLVTSSICQMHIAIFLISLVSFGLKLFKEELVMKMNEELDSDEVKWFNLTRFGEFIIDHGWSWVEASWAIVCTIQWCLLAGRKKNSLNPDRQIEVVHTFRRKFRL